MHPERSVWLSIGRFTAILLAGMFSLSVLGIRQVMADPVLAEEFVNNQRGWPNDPQSTAWLDAGSYRLHAREPGRFVAIRAPVDLSFTDVVVTGKFRKVGGPSGGGYGIVLRDQGPEPRDGINQSGQYYVLEVSDRGELGIWRREGGSWVDLLPWTPSEAVRRGGEPNELTARADGTRLALLVNGVQVASLEDTVLGEGGVGLFVGGDLNEVIVERFEVQVPVVPEASTAPSVAVAPDTSIAPSVAGVPDVSTEPSVAPGEITATYPQPVTPAQGVESGVPGEIGVGMAPAVAEPGSSSAPELAPQADVLRTPNILSLVLAFGGVLCLLAAFWRRKATSSPPAQTSAKRPEAAPAPSHQERFDR